MRTRLGLTAMFVLALLLVIQQPVHGHGYLIRAIPANGDVLERSPARIQVWFTENLEPRFSNLTLTNANGQSILLEQNGVSASNSSQLTARIPQTLPNGAYIVTMRVAFTSDGHVQSETLVFWIGEQSEAPTTTGTSSTVLPLEVIWRVLSLIGFNILFGTLLLYKLVLVPSWGNPKYPGVKLPPRVMKRLTVIIVAALVIVGIGTVLAVLQQASVLFATDIGNVLQNRLWSVVLGTTQIGSMLSLRIALIVLITGIHYAVCYLSSREPQIVSILWTLNVVVAAALFVTLSASSHAAGSALWAPGSVIVDYLHILSSGAWIGGLITLTLTLPAALATLEPIERRGALHTVLRRFSWLGMNAVVLLIVTGIYSAALHVPQASDLSGTNYGLALVAKIILIMPILLIAFYNYLMAAHGRLYAILRRFNLFERFENVINSIRLESSLGASVIFIAALLASTPPPKPPTLQQPVAPPSQKVTVDNWQVTLTIEPGAAGANSYELEILDGNKALTLAQVTLQLNYPSLDKRKAMITLDEIGNGMYLGAGSELDRAGEWAVLIDIKTAPDSTPVRAAFRWDVSSTTNLNTGREPTFLNWLSTIGVAIACLWLIVPGTLQFIRTLKLQTESVLIGIGAAIATAILLILGTAQLVDASRRSDLLNNPIPNVINPVLADLDSLTIGKHLYTEQCAACHDASAPDLQNLENNRRDEELYRSIEAHKDVKLSDNERWHIINYLRSPQFLGIRR